MINAFIIDQESDSFEVFKTYLSELCPFIALKGFSTNLLSFASKQLPIKLLFINIKFLQLAESNHLSYLNSQYELICFGANKEDAYQAFQMNATGFLLKPYEKTAFLLEMNKVQNRLNALSTTKESVQTGLVGVPTIEGFEYLQVADIIQCEGLQKCTRVITTERKDIVSSYNIGEFIKLLVPYGFFSPHKSYLINLRHVKKYCKEGTIYLTNGHHVPVSRRRKAAFLSQIPHL